MMYIINRVDTCDCCLAIPTEEEGQPIFSQQIACPPASSAVARSSTLPSTLYTTCGVVQFLDRARYSDLQSPWPAIFGAVKPTRARLHQLEPPTSTHRPQWVRLGQAAPYNLTQPVMIGLIGVVGGAAALEIRRIRRGGGDNEQEQVRDLKKAVEQTAKDLEKERRAAQEASRKVNHLQAETASLRQDAEKLQEAAEALSRQRKELEQQNVTLQINNLALSEKAAQLQSEAQDLAMVNRRLNEQVCVILRRRGLWAVWWDPGSDC